MNEFYATTELRLLIGDAYACQEQLRALYTTSNVLSDRYLALAKDAMKLTERIKTFTVKNTGDVRIKLVFYTDLLRQHGSQEGWTVPSLDANSDMIKQLFEDFNALKPR